jgi:hypothetical protein
MSSSQSNAVDRTDTTTIPTASADETALRAQFGDLSDAQFKALEDELRRIGTPGFSPFSLNLQDQQNVDAAFDAARTRFNLESRDYADTLAGGRGLRPFSGKAWDWLTLRASARTRGCHWDSKGMITARDLRWDSPHPHRPLACSVSRIISKSGWRSQPRTASGSGLAPRRHQDSLVLRN